MFITIPKVFASMGFGTGISTIFFLLVLFAALTSAISLLESAVSTVEDQWGLSRKKSTLLMFVVIVGLGSLSALGYGPLAQVKIFGMQFLDLFDFMTNSVMMPLAAIAICAYAVKNIGLSKRGAHIRMNGATFNRENIFRFMIRFICPIFVLVILLSSLAQVLGWIQM